MHADAPPMAADPSRAELDEISRAVIGAAQKVSSHLGAGFLEKVYENALAIELRRRGLRVKQQQPVQVRYGSDIVGEYLTDLLVEGAVNFAHSHMRFRRIVRGF